MNNDPQNENCVTLWEQFRLWEGCAPSGVFANDSDIDWKYR